MKLFLDSSVLLSASGSRLGASFALFSHADRNNWVLLSSPYVFAEVTRNLPKLPATAATEWFSLREQMRLVDDVFSLDRPVVFEASKDRPVLFTALASADALLTLDKKDFTSVMGEIFYGLAVLLPYDFLERERIAGRLRVDSL